MIEAEPHTPARSGAERSTDRTTFPTALVISGVAAVIVPFLFGFLLFSAQAMRPAPPIVGTADGIIVLTGGEHRIRAGASLLQAKTARRLLISGVNPQTSRDDVIRLSGLGPASFNCCVDLGYAAQDTIGNAEEARAWATGIGARRLVVVTSNYHMPRSLAELAIAMPDVEFVAHPVGAKSAGDRAWWLQPALARLLATEYVKFLPVAARYGLARQMRPARSKDADREDHRTAVRAGE